MPILGYSIRVCLTTGGRPTRLETMETWEDIEGRQVSDLGRVRIGVAMLAPYFGDNQFLFVDGCRIDHLVLETFRGPCPTDYACQHCNGVNTDNRLVNLRWDIPTLNKPGDTGEGHTVYRSDGVRFPSVRQAARLTGGYENEVYRICTGKKHSLRGFGFKFAESCNGEAWDIGSIPCTSFPIYRSDGVLFPSLSKAADSVDSRATTIASVCKGKRANIKGFGFKYANKCGGEPWTPLEVLIKTPKVGKPEDPPIPVIRSDGKRFSSLFDAGLAIKRRPHFVESVCRGATRQTAGYGFRFASHTGS